MKKVLVHFDFPSGNLMQYDNVWRDLRASGNAHPKGLLYHFGAEQPGGGFLVVDVWESENAFKEFGKILMPILEKNDVPTSLPRILPLYGIYEAQKEWVHAAEA